MAQTAVPRPRSATATGPEARMTLASTRMEPDVWAEMEERSEKAIHWRSTSAGDLDREADSGS